MKISKIDITYRYRLAENLLNSFDVCRFRRLPKLKGNCKFCPGYVSDIVRKARMQRYSVFKDNILKGFAAPNTNFH